MIPTLDLKTNSDIWFSSLNEVNQKSILRNVTNFIFAYTSDQELYNNSTILSSADISIENIFIFLNSVRPIIYKMWEIPHIKAEFKYIPENRSGFDKFIQWAHRTQKRKYTEEPYVNHIYRVCNIYIWHNYNLLNTNREANLIIDILLAHDVVEDTEISLEDIAGELSRLNYDLDDIQFILDGIDFMTDVYTSEKYPTMNRETRKYNEALRLASGIPLFILAKLSDSLDNSFDIQVNDAKFFITYKKEKLQFVELIDELNNDSIIAGKIESPMIEQINLLKAILIQYLS